MTKKLYRSRTDRIIGGLCGGAGEYLNVDANAIRLVYTIITVLTGVFPGIIAYILGIFIVPSEPLITPVASKPVTDTSEDDTINL